MFITRTLAPRDRTVTGATVARLVAVMVLVAAALFAILAVDLVGSSVSLQVGDVAPDDIQAPRSVQFVSASETEAAQAAAEAAVAPVYVEIGPQAEIRARQLASYDAEVAGIQSVLTERDAGTLSPADVQTQLRAAAPNLRASQVALLASMPTPRWAAIAAEGRRVLDQAQAGELREDALAEARQGAREAVSVDLAPDERELAGDLAAAHISGNVALSPEETAAARETARAAVDPIRVIVQRNEAVVRAGDPISALDYEKLTELGLTEPATSSRWRGTLCSPPSWPSFWSASCGGSSRQSGIGPAAWSCSCSSSSPAPRSCGWREIGPLPPSWCPPRRRSC